MTPQTESKRQYFNASRRSNQKVCDASGLIFMAPYITARQEIPMIDNLPSWKLVPFWLEYKPYGLPDEADFAHQPEISPLQQINSYDQLPTIELVPGKLETVKVVAERIKDGDVAYIPVGYGGCLWTMIPKDRDGEPGPESSHLETQVISSTHIICPHCRKYATTIDHLKEEVFAGNFKWYCNQCGYQYGFESDCHGNVVSGSLKLTGHRADKTLVLLRNGSVGLVVEGMRFVPGDGQEDDNQHDSYFYDEHTCPTNFMANVKAVFDLEKKDVDPHGIFHHVLSLPYDDRIEDGEDAFLATLMDKFGNESVQSTDAP